MQTEVLEKNKVKVVFEVSPERFEEGLKHSFSKNKSHFNIPGFRKGKVPRQMVERHYGEGVLYEDAFDFVLDDAYLNAVKESKLDVVSRPEIDVVSVSREEGVVFSAIVYTKPEVSISNYKGLSYKPSEVVVTDEEIDEEINGAREKNARMISVTDRAVQDGDTVVIDFEGFVDDVAFEGGQSAGHELVIGSNSFIPGFESQLIGHNLSEQFDITVTFPEDYNHEGLKGKDARFNIVLHEIKYKELPELNDDFAQDVSEFDTLVEYKNSISESIKKTKEQEAENDKEEAIMEELIKNSEIDLPQCMIDDQADSMLKGFAQRMTRQGISLETYLNIMGQSIEDMKNVYRDAAERQVRTRLIVEQISKIENFSASEEEFNEELQKISEVYSIEVDKIKESLRETEIEGIKEDIAVKKAIKLVLDSAVAI